MYQTACPYCSNPLIDDGTLAGQIVMCPRCGGQMQMPGMAPPPAPPSVNSQVGNLVTPSETSRTYRRSKPGPNNQLIVFGMMALALLLGGGITYLGMQSAIKEAPSPIRSKTSSKEEELRQLIALETDKYHVLFQRSEEAHNSATYSANFEKLNEAIRIDSEANQLHQSLNQHRYELAQLCLKRGDKKEALEWLIIVDKSQKGIGEFGKRVRQELTDLRGY